MWSQPIAAGSLGRVTLFHILEEGHDMGLGEQEAFNFYLIEGNM